jgi:hypothetical protein
LGGLATALLAAAGCQEHERSGFGDGDPPARIQAIHDAAAANDKAAIPDLIRSLDSDDPAERLLANQALERMTGQSFGYDHSAPRPERLEAAQKWADWYSKEGGGGRGSVTGSP